LRLRRAGRKAFLTFKGAPQKSRRFKVREEHETEVKNEKALRQILKGLGFVPAFRYTKSRTTFRKGRLRISLDETAAGDFLELEGERSDIARYARTLGFSSAEMIKQDYVQILRGLPKED
jgi:adenylate cyclase class 2